MKKSTKTIELKLNDRQSGLNSVAMEQRAVLPPMAAWLWGEVTPDVAAAATKSPLNIP